MGYNKKPSCYAPWMNTYEWTTEPGETIITPCCEWPPESPNAIKTTEHMSFEDRFNHPNWQKIRATFLTKPIEQIPECINCVNNERHGLMSHRDSINMIADKIPQPLDTTKFKLRRMDYRESNLCNFSCKMCGHYLSSTHAKIKGVGGKTGILRNAQHLQEYLNNLEDVEVVDFLGGEPTLMNSMYIVMKELKKRKLEKKVQISITTNASVLHREKNKLLEHIYGFKGTKIAVSIDATGEQHNYWRHKGTWDAVWKNTQEIYKYTTDPKNKCKLAIRTALSWPNTYAARKVFELFKDMNVQHMHNMVTTPPALNVSQLPQEYLDDLVEYWADYPQIQTVFKNTIANTDYRLLCEFFFINKKHDIWHKNSFVDAFPEFKDFYNDGKF